MTEGTTENSSSDLPIAQMAFDDMSTPKVDHSIYITNMMHDVACLSTLVVERFYSHSFLAFIVYLRFSFI